MTPQAAEKYKMYKDINTDTVYTPTICTKLEEIDFYLDQLGKS